MGKISREGKGEVRRFRRAPAAVLLTLLVIGPPSSAEEWFDAYERGLQALKQRDGMKAAQHLERAVRSHPKPGHDLITYGTNRLDEYYPYLHLAEAYLMVGNLESAREALTRSEYRDREPPGERARIAARVNTALAGRKAMKPESRDVTELARTLAARVTELEARLERMEEQMALRCRAIP